MIEKSIHAFLIADPNLSALISNRLYPISAPQGIDGRKNAYVVYTRIDTTPLLTNDGINQLTRARLQFAIYGPTYATVKDVGDKLRKANNGGMQFDGFHGTMGTDTIQGIFSIDEARDGYVNPEHEDEEGIHLLNQDYYVWFLSS